MNTLFDQLGPVSLGSRVRALGDRLTLQADEIYRLYGTELRPKWFPVLFSLSGESKSVTAIAAEIGHSHPSVSKIVREMAKEGIVTEERSPEDKRRNIISLTPGGRERLEALRPQYEDVGEATKSLLAEMKQDLWQALIEFEYLLEEASLVERVRRRKKVRESSQVEIVPYRPAHREAFRALNAAWITEHFEMEAADHKALDNPQKILDEGGAIVVATACGEVLGVCALLKMDDPDFDMELAKMAVSSQARGKGIGWLLGRATIDKARAMGARRIYLESNTKLTPAITLYRKLGFKKILGRPSPYERCNIQMELSVA